MVSYDELPDLDKLPANVEELQKVLQQEQRRLEDLREEERKQRKQRLLQKRNPQGAAAPPPGKASTEVVARVSTPLSPSSSRRAACLEARSEVRYHSPGGSTRVCQTAEEAQAERCRLDSELRKMLSDTRARLADTVRAGGPLDELRMSLAVVADMARLEPEWGAEETLASLALKARELQIQLERRAEAAREAERVAIATESSLAQAAAAMQRPLHDSPKRARFASGGPEMMEADESEAESITSEDRRLEAEIQDLEAILRSQQESSHPSSSSSASAPSSSSPKGQSKGASSPAGKSAGKGPSKGLGKGAVAGKGTGKGVAKGPPPPSDGKGNGKGAAPKGPPALAGKAKGGIAGTRPMSPTGKHPPPAKAMPNPKTSKLVNLHWRVSSAPEDGSNIGTGFLERLEQACSGDGKGAASIEEVPEVLFPLRPATVFDPMAAAEEPPRAVLEHYFTKTNLRTSWKAHSGAEHDEKHFSEGWKKSRLDEKVVKMMEIVMKRHIMEHKSSSEREATMCIKKAILMCDFNTVRLEGLSVIRTAMRQHEKDGRQVCELVRLRGEDVLDEVELPELHRFIWELCKIPQIDERLECMLFHITFEENFLSCQTNLQTLRRVLQMLNSKRETIQRFFMTAHKLGQSLNRGSNAQQAPNGFQLNTLEKLSQTRSTKFPKLSILHFVLALVSRSDARDLFDTDDLALLQSAKALRTHKVYQECVELAQGIYGVQDICETGNYTCPATGEAIKIERRRKSLTPQTLGLQLPPEVDSDDCFHEVLKGFVDESLGIAEDIAEGAFEAILTYKELALYFDDLHSVYPPPKNERDPRKDLCEIFYKFAEEIKKHRDQVESQGLRDLIENSTAPDSNTPEPPARVSLPVAAHRTASPLRMDESPMRKPRFTQEESALRVSPIGDGNVPRKPRFTHEEGALRVSPVGDGTPKRPRFTQEGSSPGRPPLPLSENSPCRMPLPRPESLCMRTSRSPAPGGAEVVPSGCRTPGCETPPEGASVEAAPGGAGRKFELIVTPTSRPGTPPTSCFRNRFVDRFVDRELEHLELDSVAER